MTIGVVSKGSIGSTGGTATYGATSTVSLASGGAVGDLELEVVGWDQIPGTTVAAGGDWNQLTVQSAGAVFWRTRTAGSADTLPLTFTGGSETVGFHASGVRYSGVGGGIGGAVSINEGYTTSAVTATVAGVAVVLWAFQIAGGSATMPGSPWTPDGAANNDSSPITLGLMYGTGIAEKVISAAGSTGTALLSWSGSGFSGIAVTVMVEQNHPPTQPTWLSPADGTALNRQAAQALQYRFETPDSNVQPATRTWRYSSNGGTSWTTGATNEPVDGSTILGEIDLTASELTGGTYQFQIEITDSNGLTSPWSPSLHLTFGDPPATPSISSPTSGSTIPGASQPFTITDTDAYSQMRYSAVDSAGNTIAALTAAAGPSFTLAGLRNGTTVTVTVAVQGSNGVWSANYSETFAVSYTPPPVPRVTYFGPGDPDDTGDVASLTLTWHTPSPVGGDPAAVSALLEYSRDAGTTVERNLSTSTVSGQDVFATPALNVDYQARITVTAASGATSTTGWIS